MKKVEVTRLGEFSYVTTGREFQATLLGSRAVGGFLSWHKPESGIPGLIVQLEQEGQTSDQAVFLGRQGALLEVRDEQMAISTLKQMLSHQ